MKARIIPTLALLFLPSTVLAQSFDTVDSCQNLQQEVTAAVEESRGLSSLLTEQNLTEEAYLTQLYEGIKILSKSGEMFFKASDSHESTCKTILAEAKKMEQLRGIYDWYLEPVQVAYRFFKRAREAAIRLNRQGDVDVFNSAMTEYDAAIMKLVAVCESDLTGTDYAATCKNLSAKLNDALK